MLKLKVREAIKKYNLISPNEKVLIGVSGGPDSLALLHVLASLQEELRFKLHIAHLDHMLRKDSDLDRKFVEDIGKKLRIPVTTAKINVKGLAKKGSVEEIARNVRLGFLFKTAQGIFSKKIALAHTFDDQAETVLMRLIRGSGLQGLAGMPYKRHNGAYEVIRPLIEVRRREVEAYLAKRKIKARTDPSNLKDVYFRNKIRNKLLPLLETEYNNNIKEAMNNLGAMAACDYDYLYLKASQAKKRLGKNILLERLLRLHPAIQRMLIRLQIADLQGDTRRITFKHMQEIEDLIRNRPANSIVHLPKGIFVQKKKRRVIFAQR